MATTISGDGVRTITLAAAATESYRVDWDRAAQSGWGLGCALEFDGTATASVQVSYDGTNWHDAEDTALVGATADAIGGIDHPAPLVRLNVTAWTSGDVRLHIYHAR